MGIHSIKSSGHGSLAPKTLIMKMLARKQAKISKLAEDIYKDCIRCSCSLTHVFSNHVVGLVSLSCDKVGPSGQVEESQDGGESDMKLTVR